MKFAVTAQGPDAESLVDPRFGRAHYLHVAVVELRDTPTIQKGWVELSQNIL